MNKLRKLGTIALVLSMLFSGLMFTTIEVSAATYTTFTTGTSSINNEVGYNWDGSGTLTLTNVDDEGLSIIVPAGTTVVLVGESSLNSIGISSSYVYASNLITYQVVDSESTGILNIGNPGANSTGSLTVGSGVTVNVSDSISLGTNDSTLTIEEGGVLNIASLISVGQSGGIDGYVKVYGELNIDCTNEKDASYGIYAGVLYAGSEAVITILGVTNGVELYGTYISGTYTLDYTDTLVIEDGAQILISASETAIIVSCKATSNMEEVIGIPTSMLPKGVSVVFVEDEDYSEYGYGVYTLVYDDYELTYKGNSFSGTGLVTSVDIFNRYDTTITVGVMADVVEGDDAIIDITLDSDNENTLMGMVYFYIDEVLVGEAWVEDTDTLSYALKGLEVGDYTVIIEFESEDPTFNNTATYATFKVVEKTVEDDTTGDIVEDDVETDDEVDVDDTADTEDEVDTEVEVESDDSVDTSDTTNVSFLFSLMMIAMSGAYVTLKQRNN